MSDKLNHWHTSEDGTKRLAFRCPGCKEEHTLNDKTWKWNGSLEKPTLAPSYLIHRAGHPEERRCHSFITDGKIQFLDDCHHELKGQTVDLPDWKETP